MRKKCVIRDKQICISSTRSINKRFYGKSSKNFRRTNRQSLIYIEKYRSNNLCAEGKKLVALR